MTARSRDPFPRRPLLPGIKSWLLFEQAFGVEEVPLAVPAHRSAPSVPGRSGEVTDQE